MSTVSHNFGWAGVAEMQTAWQRAGSMMPTFHMIGAVDRKRTVAWDDWAKLGFDINRSTLVEQKIGDCVSFGAAIAVAAVAAHEIVRLGDLETLKVPFCPYLYGHSRLAPEGGNGRISGDGSLGIWMAMTIQKYGVLREDYPGVPPYSGAVARSWGSSKTGWGKFVNEGSAHLIKTAARLSNVDDVIDAICSGHYCTIASNRGFSMRFRDDRGKSWWTGRDSWAHQMSFIGYDNDPEPCLYLRNQWGAMAFGPQLDGPPGGGWITCQDCANWIADGDTEVFAFSMFEGFPSDEQKPQNYFL